MAFDSILALDLETGAIKWAKHTVSFDAFNVACDSSPHGVNCPVPNGSDLDFASGPNLFTTSINGTRRQVLGIGQKDGTYFTLNPATGAQIWSQKVGPGGEGGGIERETATDGERVYIMNSNANGERVTLIPSGEVTTFGFWSALDTATGRILWQTANPAGDITWGPVSVANGVVYVSSFDPRGTVFALNAATGKILFRFETGGSVGSGAAISNGVVYWGSGYALFDPPFGTGNNKLYAFEVRPNCP